jgi:ABC-type molybdate transport system substrate-binding protein
MDMEPTTMAKKEIVFAKKQLVLLATLKGKVSELILKWKGTLELRLLT